MRKKISVQHPAAMACAFLQDGRRALFLVRKTFDGKEEIELPCIAVMKGEDPVSAAKAELLRAAGIDGHALGAAFSGDYNCGTKRRKIWIRAIAFKFEAKGTRASASSEYAGAKWLSPEDAKKFRLSRKCSWLQIG